MDATAHQWPQGVIGVVNKHSIEGSTRPDNDNILERKARPQKDQALNCPRCNSTNTKFCYYNNYSLSQPRYFCKTCRRYWTDGGSLRNVPVGGGSRKNKRVPPSSTSTSTSASTKKLHPNLTNPTGLIPENPNKIHQGQDLNLAYRPSGDQNYGGLSKLQNPSSSSCHNISGMELLKSSGLSSRGLMGSFMTMAPVVSDSNTMYTTGFPNLQEFKPTLNFSMEGFEAASGYGSVHHHGVHETGARALFPMEDLKQVASNNTEFEQNRGHGDSSSGYWNGMLGGGGSW